MLLFKIWYQSIIGPAYGCTIGVYLVLYISNVYTLVWDYTMHVNYGLLIGLHWGTDKVLQCCVMASQISCNLIRTNLNGS